MLYLSLHSGVWLRVWHILNTIWAAKAGFLEETTTHLSPNKWRRIGQMETGQGISQEVEATSKKACRRAVQTNASEKRGSCKVAGWLGGWGKGSGRDEASMLVNGLTAETPSGRPGQGSKAWSYSIRLVRGDP